MTDHDLSVWTQGGPDNRHASSSYCSCGWVGPMRSLRIDATNDAADHLKEPKTDEYAIKVTVDGKDVDGTDVNIGYATPEGHINIRVTTEGIILDSYGPQAEVRGTFGRTFDELHEFLEAR